MLLQQHGGEALTSCKLHFEGFGNKQGLKTAHLDCTGGSIQASAHPSVLGPFTHSFSGVTWSTAGDCGAYKDDCALTLCGNSSVLFVSAVVSRVNITTAAMLLCVGGNSNVVFDGAQFQGNTARPVSYFSGVKLHIKGCNFKNNSISWQGSVGGALFVDGGSALVESSSFIGNSAQYRGGAIGVRNSAHLKLVASVVKDNAGGSHVLRD